MALATLACASIGTNDQWTLDGGASKVAAVALPDDDNTTRITETTINEKQSFNMDDLPAAAAGVVDVNVHSRGLKTGATNETYLHFIRLAGNITNGVSNTLTSGVYNNFVDLAMARPGGGSWAVADVNAMEVGLHHDNAGANFVAVTTLYATVNYNVAAGGVLLFVAQWLPPLIASGLFGGALRAHDLNLLRAFQRTIRRSGILHMPSNPREVRAIIEALGRRPAFAI
jgi:hypothetical protein